MNKKISELIDSHIRYYYNLLELTPKCHIREVIEYLVGIQSELSQQKNDNLKSFHRFVGEGERLTLYIEGTDTVIPRKIWNTEEGFNELIVSEVYGKMTEEEVKHQESGGFIVFTEEESFKKVYKDFYNEEITDSIIYSSDGVVFK